MRAPSKDQSRGGAEVDEDALFRGRLKLFQPAKGAGYRTNVDALLLAAFARRERAARLAVDLGAGVGAVGLALLHFQAAGRVEFVERDAFAAGLCERNLRANGWDERGGVVIGDLARSMDELAPHLSHKADLVVANPPYFTFGTRPTASSAEARREAARHGDLRPFLRAATEAMGRRARACIVYPAGELLSAMTEARKLSLVPKRIRFVHARADRAARVVLIELARAKDGGLVVEPPLVELDEHRRPTPELSRILDGAPGG